MKSSYFNRILLLLNKHPRRGKRLIGLSETALWELWQRVVELDRAKQKQRANEPGRKRLVGGGRKKAVDVLCRLLVTLIYLRQHWTMQAIGECIEVAEATVFNYIHEMLPYIEAALPASLLEQWQQECSAPERLELEQWFNCLPEGFLLVDAWEQPIHRPLENDKQQQYYSGKKKQHTRKNQVIVLPKGIDIVDVEIGKEGRINDSKLLLSTQDKLPQGLPLIGDKAYVGRDNTLTPFKKPKGGQLNQMQESFNHWINQQRSYVEHIIRVIKIFRIAKETFRMREQIYEQVIRCVCGLVRLRVQYAYV